ncbi:23S rRNA (uracil(1939)-C(5))-methyltransferase RlmD [Candidatus Woesearchaeota archaeon]|nr:23S rRNA (uracil(1939)-C(5))-methyltransferase RlmD [Candidatus Woesearchaeota archaeon]
MRHPLCPQFGTCGGCTAQHIEYCIQLENKKKALAHALGKASFLDKTFSENNIKLFSGNEFYYRNRMDFLFHSNNTNFHLNDTGSNGIIGIGLRKKDDYKKIIDVEKCVISNKKLNELLTEIRSFFMGKERNKPVDIFNVNRDIFNMNTRTGTLRYVVIRAPQNDSSISFVLNPDSKRINETLEQIKEFAKITSANNVLVAYVPSQADVSISDDFFVVKGTDMLKETYLGKTFFYHSQGFFQNNSEMAEKMHEYCLNLLTSYSQYTKPAHLLDLYGGVGTFGIINADLFKGVTIVESVKQCIDAADKNIVANKIKNAKAVVLDAINLKKLKLPEPLFVITDPPRSGMDMKTIEQLKILKPKLILYVSCNVQQLAKDIPKFKQYKIKSAALFDLFPQTVHSEAVVELVRTV